jgi:hypothetical protein
MKNIKKERMLQIVFILISILFVLPSIIYLIQNKTVMGFETYYNFFINDGTYKTISSIIYLMIFIAMTAIYLIFIKKEIFKNIKEVLIYTGIVGAIFVVMLPWTSSDIFYYMGVGELNSVYGQNPYYVTIEEYYEQNQENLQDDTIMLQGAENYWAGTTVVYGPIAQLIFTVLTKISFKNVDLCLIIFKLVNLLVHIANCYLIYKLTKKLKFAIIYGLNPFVFLEFIGNVHNDVILVLFVLVSLYFLIKKKRLLPSIVFLAIATGIKYVTILLLPVIILYYFRKEERIGIRFLRCIQYGVIFLLIFFAEYIMYFRNVEVLTAMMAQTARYCKSIYSGLYAMGITNKHLATVTNWNSVRIISRNVMLIVFVYMYMILCINLLTTRKINFYKIVRKYNIMLVLFLLALSNFQQWYLVWLFPTIMWQKPNTIRNIIGLTVASEIANSVYMFKIESWKYDFQFVIILATIYIIWQLSTNKGLEKSFCNKKSTFFQKNKYENEKINNKRM